MCRKTFLALCGATIAFVVAPAGGALAAGGTKVTVRVEGRTKTLLVPKTVQTHTGSITKGATPTGKCPATSAAGALDVATHHNWDGKYSSSVKDIFITKILGDNESGTKFFWEIFKNNVASSTGACGLTLRHGDQLLFAVVPATTAVVYPLAMKAPHHAKLGHSFKVKVVWFDAKGKRKPLAGVHVHIGTVTALTNKHGVVRVDPTHKGTLVLRGDKTGYIRAAPLRVHVSA